MKQEDSHGTTRSPYRRRRAWIVFGLLAILILVLAAACGGDDEAAAPPAAEEPAPPAEPAEPATGGEEPAPAPAEGEWSLAEAAAPYAGTTINVLDEVTDLQPTFAELIPQFEEETGINVEFSIEGHVDVIQKGEADLLAGRGEYDLVMVHDFQMGRVIDADVIEPIDQYLNNPDLKDPSVNFEDFIPGPTEASTIYDGQRICFPAWPYNYIYWVRNDYLTNPDEQAAFEEQYGYPLALPETMDQMYDIAEFFTRDAGETLAGETLSEPMYGFVQEGARLSVPWSPIYWLYMRQYGGGWFNEDGTPNFSRPENVEAMEFYKSLWEFSPPGAIEFSLIDIPVVMGEGRAASGLVWSDFVFSIDTQGGSPYAGNFAYAPPPAVGDGANRATLVALGCEVINKASENKEAAFLFSQWMASKSTQDAWFDMEGAAMPVRLDSFEHPALTSGPYAPMFAAAVPALEGGSSWTQIPKMFEIGDTINLEQQKLVNGEVTAQEMVDNVQAAAEDICEDGSCFAEKAVVMP
jgi:multiple sugar transport system substrate-binding protein